jgi:hypothetical protein
MLRMHLGEAWLLEGRPHVSALKTMRIRLTTFPPPAARLIRNLQSAQATCLDPVC